MRPSAPQAAPPGAGASATIDGGPPAAAIFFSLPSAKNPSHRPSGEKNGDGAAFGPGELLHASRSTGRT